MIDAMRSSEGIPGLNVSQSETIAPNSSTHVKFDGVKAVTNIEY